MIHTKRGSGQRTDGAPRLAQVCDDQGEQSRRGGAPNGRWDIILRYSNSAQSTAVPSPVRRSARLLAMRSARLARTAASIAPPKRQATAAPRPRPLRRLPPAQAVPNPYRPATDATLAG